jgi:hypothetical protein
VNLTKYTNWQDGRKPGVPYTRLSPALAVLLEYLLKRWGGQSLGGYGVRPIRGGVAYSSHSFGAAFDWRWENPGPGRQVVEDTIIPWLIGNSHELGIQAIHDYRGCRIWRSMRPGSIPGWQIQKPDGYGMGQAWAGWLHIEVCAQDWGNSTAVEDRIAGALDVPRATLKQGMLSDEVKKLYDHLLFFKFVGVQKNPRRFGPRIRKGVEGLQRELGVKVDGVWGPLTQAAYARWLAGR